MMLKSRLPKEGKNLLSGVTVVEEAWQILENFYGNKQMIIACMVEELLSTRLNQGSPHRNLEQLCQELQSGGWRGC